MTVGLTEKRRQKTTLKVFGEPISWAIYPYAPLHSSARLFIGIKQSTGMDNAGVAACMGFSVERIDAFEREILATREGFLAVRRRLPSIYGESGPKAAKCKKCRKLITFFPCSQCCDMPINIVSRAQSKELSECKLPTYATPGSLEKVAIMRLRIAKGMSPFCNGDAAITEGTSAANYPLGRLLANKTRHSAPLTGPFESEFPDEVAQEITKARTLYDDEPERH